MFYFHFLLLLDNNLINNLNIELFYIFFYEINAK